MFALAAIALIWVALALPAAAGNDLVELPRFPSISPDGSEVVFSWGGDLWRVSAQGGQATRLTRHNLDDMHSTWSPDGQWITFTSMRDGYMNLWRLHRSGSSVSQLTYSDRFIRHPAYGLDENGRMGIVFSGALEADVFREQRPYAISQEGGEPRRVHDAFGSEPKVSPDGRRVVFTRGGYYHDWGRRHYRGPDAMNVWLYDRQAKSFEALTEWEGDDGSAQWQDDQTLIFMSDRELDTINLYRLNVDSDERVAERLTHFDGRDIQHFDVSHDGRTAVVHVWDTLYTLDLTDPNAEPVALTIRASEDGRDDYTLRRIDRDVTEAALSPDGKVMAYIAYGRVYVRHLDDHSPTRAVTPDSHARHQHLSWSPDGLRLFFTNDSDGTDSIYQARVALTRDEIRSGTEGRPAARRVEVEVSAVASATTELPLIELSDPDEPTLVPGGRGGEPEDPFGPVDPGLPHGPVEPEPEPEPAPFDPGVTLDLPVEPETIPEEDLDTEPAEDRPADKDPSRWHDAVRFTVEPVVRTHHNDRNALVSPDGQTLAFRRGLGNLVLKDLRTGKEKTLVEGWDTGIHWRWSPDSQYIAYSQNDMNFSANIFIVPADGSRDAVNVTRHPRNDINPRWSADGRILTFISNRSADSYDIYRIYLDHEIENYTPRELTTYYRDARNDAGKIRPLPVAAARLKRGRSSSESVIDGLDLENAWRRVQRVTSAPTHQFGNEMTPGGDRYVFNSSGEGLMVMNWNGENRQRLGPTVNMQHLDIRGERIVYVAGGRVGVANLSGGSHRRPDITDRIRIDLRQESLQKFNEAARMIGESFYLSDMKGLDWPAVVKDYESLIRRARTASEFSDISNRLMGELAASHMGVTNPGPASALREPSGRLGIDYEHVYLNGDRAAYRVTAVLPGGPATRGPIRLEVGDLITEIDMQPFTRTDTLLHRLRGRTGQEVIVTFEREHRGRNMENHALLMPIDYSALVRLKYDDFREQSRRRVEELSGGRLGYLHIQAMNQASLEEFQGDLYAAAMGKEGLIIDVRNNGGGHTTDRILTSITAPEHAYTVPAGADPSRTGHYPQDRLDAPRYTMAINMLSNEKSYSNAEILAHAFKSVGRGTLIGQQTYGGVISTGSHTLLDGATVRRPFRGWYMPDGTDMEHNGAMPDIVIQQTPEDEVSDRDRQLEAAVRDMLKRIDGQQ
ncbi:S41 family peptidase [Marinimicrobium sp. ABcell2]|uniref:S41 family peptidase n=1 Tax=Marinimicrobium sp. ABcell2 TaxID=3069751 RepID=UPI0027B85246|nr:S41 family peptidase [Marinimicrobium sp. ABcell2]MDQ2077203.1 S41 family peptidase [Marinimicrobium sp. ABcell2]